MGTSKMEQKGEFDAHSVRKHHSVGSQEQGELPAIVRWGRWLLGVSLAALGIGGATVKMFFPDRLGKGLDVVAWSILIPIWAVGIAGILLLLVGWVRYPDLNTRLELGIPERADGKLFGPFTKSLACLTLALIWLAGLAIWAEPDRVLPVWKNHLIFYFLTAYCWFLFYLTFLYDRARHHATTTYLNHFNPMCGTLLIPLTWWLLIGLNWAVVRGKAADSSPPRTDSRKYEGP